MKIRVLRESDKSDVNRIYNEFYMFNEYPNFFSREYLQPFAITDDNDKVIIAGGIKYLPEIVLVTDKSIPVRTRYEALLQAMGSAVTIAADIGHKKIYAFVNNDEKYVEILKKHHFQLIDAKLLVLNLGEQDGSA